MIHLYFFFISSAGWGRPPPVRLALSCVTLLTPLSTSTSSSLPTHQLLGLFNTSETVAGLLVSCFAPEQQCWCRKGTGLPQGLPSPPKQQCLCRRGAGLLLCQLAGVVQGTPVPSQNATKCVPVRLYPLDLPHVNGELMMIARQTERTSRCAGRATAGISPWSVAAKIFPSVFPSLSKQRKCFETVRGTAWLIPHGFSSYLPA